MTKDQLLEKLKKELSSIPSDELDGRLAFYSEMIDDRIEEGLDEEAAVAAIGDIDEIIAHEKKKNTSPTNPTKLPREISEEVSLCY